MLKKTFLLLAMIPFLSSCSLLSLPFKAIGAATEAAKTAAGIGSKVAISNATGGLL